LREVHDGGRRPRGLVVAVVVAQTNPRGGDQRIVDRHGSEFSLHNLNCVISVSIRSSCVDLTIWGILSGIQVVRSPKDAVYLVEMISLIRIFLARGYVDLWLE
jgi:hypothetical protein